MINVRIMATPPINPNIRLKIPKGELPFSTDSSDTELTFGPSCKDFGRSVDDGSSIIKNTYG